MVRRVSENPEEIGRDKLTFPRNRAYRGRSRGRTHGKLVRAAVQSLPPPRPPPLVKVDSKLGPRFRASNLPLSFYIYMYTHIFYPSLSNAFHSSINVNFNHPSPPKNTRETKNLSNSISMNGNVSGRKRHWREIKCWQRSSQFLWREK